ncbi:arad-like aldolase/epimerase [Aspergillus ibericus CBS 121593]|uniref:Arad-like aldolase/epimerase n=1 Tax=Aspergillus ibericus CBS 121593 TaxID=1448316 RepID=A0A395H991_9EURO|nr:arad-like aldolase/epimerase [Aspergillus ibericus CBS 121593]RAL04521.1 arad-like aldolase/epimerase [Aspergillus ibericus CBS 121593]
MSSTTTATVPTQEEPPAQVESNIQGKSAIQAISQGNTLPGVPSFTSMDKKRRWMLEHMAGAFRVFARKGFSEGMSGHISLRDPEHPDCFWTNPLGLHFGQVKVSDLILLNHAGEPVGGNRSRPANAAGFQIHGVLHKMYPQVNAACHAHSKYGKAWSTFAKPLDMINQDVTMFYGDAQAVYPEFGGVVLETEESLRLGRHLGNNGKLLILRNHGLLTVGETVDEAAYLFTLAERSCEIQLQVDAAAAQGMEKKLIEPEAAAFTFKMTSDPEALYCEFQPDYEMELERSNGRFLQ